MVTARVARATVMALVVQRVGKGIALDDIDARGLGGQGHGVVVDALVRLI